MHSTGVADKLSSPYLGCCVCRGVLSNWLARSMRLRLEGHSARPCIPTGMVCATMYAYLHKWCCRVMHSIGCKALGIKHSMCHNCDSCGHMVLCQHSPSSSAALVHILVLWVQEANRATEDRTLYQAPFYVSRRASGSDSWWTYQQCSL